jgi:hypothetical protein
MWAERFADDMIARKMAEQQHDRQWLDAIALVEDAQRELASASVFNRARERVGMRNAGELGEDVTDSTGLSGRCGHVGGKDISRSWAYESFGKAIRYGTVAGVLIE